MFDTLNGPFMDSIPKGMVKDNQGNRLNAALACIYQLARQLRAVQNELYELKTQKNMKF